MQNLVSTLTTREKEVLDLLITGAITSHIARELCISEQTVKYHLTNIYNKLGVKNRSAAVAYGMRDREIETPEVTDGSAFTEKQIRAAAKMLVDIGAVDRKVVNDLVLDLLAVLGGKM